MKIKAFDSRNRVVFSVTRDEAWLLVDFGAAEWRGKRNNPTLSVSATKPQIIEFVRMMRFKEPAKASGLDSKTTSSHGSTNPWKNVTHVRNYAYEDPIATRLDLQYATGAHSGFTPRVVKQNATR